MKKKIIINGYFRSGTTIIWHLIKHSNKNRLFLYEPCHQDICDKILHSSKDAHPIHGIKLWEDYSFLSDEIINIFMCHRGDSFFPNYSFFSLLTNILSEQPDFIGYQTNRCHFILKDFAKDKNFIPIHIIRNPVSVWNSMINFKIKSGVFPFLERAKFFLFKKNLFNINDQLKEILDFHVKKDFSCIERESAFMSFIFIWLICNAYSIEQCNSYGGKVFFFQKKKEFIEEFSLYMNKIGIPFNNYNSIFKEDFNIEDERLSWYPDVKGYAEKMNCDRYLNIITDFLSSH
ncbi:MAG: hypothetical protein ACL93V_17225 [Candidatus Electrothrix sp. YB6]